MVTSAQQAFSMLRIMVFHKEEIDFLLLQVWHHEPFSFPEQNNSYKVTVHEAIGDLPFLENGSSICYMPYSGESVSNYLD